MLGSLGAEVGARKVIVLSFDYNWNDGTTERKMKAKRKTHGRTDEVGRRWKITRAVHKRY